MQSALSYIPETTWNDSCTNALFSTVGFSSNAETNCNNSQLVNFVNVVGGSGGVSACTTPSGQTPASCSGGYVKPSWQAGTGVPQDGKRDIPDVSLFASNGFVGEVYLVCEGDIGAGCQNGDYAGFGGTSVSSPAFAGLMALVVEKTGSRQGNANYVLYKLAQKSGASCTSSGSESSSCIFNDVTVGTNGGPCLTGSPSCNTKNSGDQYGVLSGYNAAAGYDLATGLGSVNANNLVNAWTSASAAASVTTLTNVSPTTVTHGQPVTFTVTVKPQSGTGTPTGAVSLIGPTDSNNTEQGIAGFNLSSGTLTASTDLLPGGTYSLTAHYPGDATYGPSDSTPMTVTVNKENSQSQMFLVTYDSNGNVINPNTNTAQYGSPYLLRVNVENSAGKMCAPVAATGATACPSGNVVLTNNGGALDAGSYTLNSFGYLEDQTVQLPGATDSVKAAYAGDNGFNASSVTSAITITPAPTIITQPGVSAYGTVGNQLTIPTQVIASSSGAVPAGTVTFFSNGTPMAGTVAYQGFTVASAKQVFLNATFTSTTAPFTAPGTFTITTQYNGDGNYAPSAVSVGSQISVVYPTPSVVVTPYNQTVNYGGTASITALVDTTNKSVYPTGTVTFSGSQFGAPIAGPTACTNAKDVSGNFACQVVGTFTVTSGGSIFVSYSGDANYPPSNNQAYINMPDFMVSPVQGGVSVTAGQSQSVTVNFNSVSGFSGTVTNLVCSGLPAETSCTFSPTQVTLPANGSVSTMLTVTTTALGESRHHALKGQRPMNWGITGSMILLGACFVAIPFSRRRGRVFVAVMLVAVLVVLPSCGGGGSGGGGGGGGNSNPVPSISSLSPTQVAAGSQIQLLEINGSNFLNSSTVTYNGTLHDSALQSSNQMEIALGPSDVASTGQYPVVVTNPSPGGGASAPMNFAIVTGTPTGNFNFTFSATAGPITHNTGMSVTVQ